MSVGTYGSGIAHIYVTGPTTSIKMENARIEAQDKDTSRPVVIIDDSSYTATSSTAYLDTRTSGQTRIVTPGINVMSQKSVGLDPPRR